MSVTRFIQSAVGGTSDAKCVWFRGYPIDADGFSDREAPPSTQLNFPHDAARPLEAAAGSGEYVLLRQPEMYTVLCYLQCLTNMTCLFVDSNHLARKLDSLGKSMLAAGTKSTMLNCNELQGTSHIVSFKHARNVSDRQSNRETDSESREGDKSAEKEVTRKIGAEDEMCVVSLGCS